MTTRMPEPSSVLTGPGGLGRATRLDSETQVADMAAWLLSPHRTETVLVVTTAAGETAPFLDAAGLAADYGHSVEVYVVANGPLTRHLQALLPEHTEVYGGAARVYPPGTGWTSAIREAPLVFCQRGRTPRPTPRRG